VKQERVESDAMTANTNHSLILKKMAAGLYSKLDTMTQRYFNVLLLLTVWAENYFSTLLSNLTTFFMNECCCDDSSEGRRI
jgi:hypothetical protein